MFAINVKSDNAKITKIAFNKKVPVEINVPRMLGLILICLIVESIKNRGFWKEKYSYKSIKQNLTLVMIINLGIIVIYLINSGCASKGEDLYNKSLVEALSKGQVSISDVPSNNKLEDLENPYDFIERNKLNRDTDYIWDAAYFNQKYYVYFGALPALILMVPYHLITKKFLQSATVTLLFSICSIPVLVLLTKKVFQKYFKELPFYYMAASALIMVVGTMLIWINVAPRFYELVTVAGFFFAILGFLLVFDSENEQGQISFKKIFAGCFSLAAAVACRPTQVFASLLIVPILWKYFKQFIILKKELVKQVEGNSNKIKDIYIKILKLLFAVAIPYIIVASGVMRYNYLRFGSPFEFGEKYQLTVNNMKELSLRWVLLPTGIICNLFNLPTFQGFFPFLQANGNIIDTYGYYYVEDMVGGVLWITPMAIFCFGILWLWKKSKNKDLKVFTTTLLITGLIFVTFISLKAGSTGRYLFDFAWIFVLCGISIFMEIMRSLKTDEAKIILGKEFNVIVCYTLIINILSGFCVIGGNNSMKNNSPKQYFDAEYTVMILK